MRECAFKRKSDLNDGLLGVKNLSRISLRAENVVVGLTCSSARGRLTQVVGLICGRQLLAQKLGLVLADCLELCLQVLFHSHWDEPVQHRVGVLQLIGLKQGVALTGDQRRF